MTVISLSERNWKYSNQLGIVSSGDILELTGILINDRNKALRAKRVYSLSFIHNIASMEMAQFLKDTLLEEVRDYQIEVNCLIDKSKIVKDTYTLFFKLQGTGEFLKGDNK